MVVNTLKHKFNFNEDATEGLWGSLEFKHPQIHLYMWSWFRSSQVSIWGVHFWSAELTKLREWGSGIKETLCSLHFCYTVTCSHSIRPHFLILFYSNQRQKPSGYYSLFLHVRVRSGHLQRHQEDIGTISVPECNNLEHCKQCLLEEIQATQWCRERKVKFLWT